MSLTAYAWIIMFVGFSLLSLRKASWGAALYMLTFFALPDFWWWGKGTALAGQRWSFMSGIIFLLSAFIHNPAFRPVDVAAVGRALAILTLMLLNATGVHLFLAGNQAQSALVYTLLWKMVLLYWTITFAIHTRQDFYNVALAILLGAGYIGYEATINDRGAVVRGRLEGIGTAAADNANHLAALFVTILPILGGVFFLQDRRIKILSILLLPLIVNVILLCNSRGAFLGLIGAGIVLFVLSKGQARKRAVRGLALGALAFFFLMNDPQIWNRFMTTFAGEEERDASAAGRLTYWKAGMLMLSDRPFGSGGGGFKFAYGARYLGKVGVWEENRSVHNGYLNEACEWGIQGLALRLMFLLTIFAATYRAMAYVERMGDAEFAFLGSCLCSALVCFLIVVLFGDGLDAEWGFWWAGLSVAYIRLAYATAPQAVLVPVPWATVDGRAARFEPVPTTA